MNQIITVRQQKDDFFKKSQYSPLLPQQQVNFTGLNYFDPNPALAFELKPEPYADQRHVQMQTSKGEVRSYQRWGRAVFTVDGQEVQLSLYFTPGQPAFFVPFTDSTSGTETYSGGRYLDVERSPDGKIHLDFNVAYNPYCVYGDQWNCPIPPAENRLKVAIRAGEKLPSGEWVKETHE
ncbi:MAG: DUF1684 domain-containing protein [Chloroflexota bacterium]